MGISGVTGDLPGLRAIQAKLGEAASPAFRNRLAKNLAQESLKLLRDEFAKSVGPDGTPWAPIRERARNKKAVIARAKKSGAKRVTQAAVNEMISRSSKPLLDTGRLRNSFTSHVSGDGQWTVGSNVAYAAAHQFGAKIIRKASINLHGWDGRFIAKGKAPKLSKRLIKNAQTGRGHTQGFSFVSVTHAFGYRLRARPMLPVGSLGPVWGGAFTRVASKIAKKQFGIT